MSWKDRFRGLKLRRKQREKGEKERARENKKTEKEHRKIVGKYERQVGKVIRKFGRASGFKLRESLAGSGLWHQPSYFQSYQETKNYFVVGINHECVSVAMNLEYPWLNKKCFLTRKIPLDSFTEDALAEALVELYEKYNLDYVKRGGEGVRPMYPG